ncbi:hypothetical protein BDN72DRAFT_743062, partial [Pluteus cervinus]
EPINLDDNANLEDPAISAHDRVLLQNVRNKIMNISMESCVHCHEKWFDLGVNGNGYCNKCKPGRAHPEKFQAVNNMYPGAIPENLPQLTQIEEMMISPVHALVQLWQVRG